MILTFVSLIICCPNLFSQIAAEKQRAEKEAVLLDSFGRLPNGDLRGRLDVFLAEVAVYREKGTRGVVVIYGTVREVEARKRLFSNHMGFRGFDTTLVSFRRGGNVSEFRTELWIVPNGADDPKLPPEAFIIDEVGNTTRAKFVALIKKVFREAANVSSHHIYIINYGTNAEIAVREKWITREVGLGTSDRSRITMIKGGRKSGLRTVFWLAPPGAANPAP